MRIHKELRPELVASNDPSRFTLTAPWLDKAAGKVIATDGAVMVVLPVIDVAEQDEEGAYLTADALKAGRKAAGRIMDYAELVATRKGVTLPLNGTVLPTDSALTEANPPNWKRVIPEDPGGFTVTLDAELLVRLQRAMGATSVTLCFAAGKNPELCPMLVKPSMGGRNSKVRVKYGSLPAPDAFGVLMPCPVG